MEEFFCTGLLAGAIGAGVSQIIMLLQINHQRPEGIGFGDLWTHKLPEQIIEHREYYPASLVRLFFYVCSLLAIICLIGTLFSGAI